MKKIEYKLSLDAAKALTGLQSLAKSAEDFNNKTKEITPDFLKIYEKEINKSIKTQNTLSLKLDKLNKDFSENSKAVALANEALKSDAFIQSAKKVETYKEQLKKMNDELKALAKDQKAINPEVDPKGFNEIIAKQEELKNKILETKESIKTESAEYRNAEKARDNLLKKQSSLKTKIDETTDAMENEKQASAKLRKDLDDLADKSEEVEKKQSSMGDSFKKFAMTAGTALVGMFAVDKVVDFGKASIEAFKVAEKGYKSFASSVKANGESMYDATRAVTEITKNGGINNTQAQEALVNYMRMGFDIKEAKEQVIRELDLATDRGQAHYKTAGEAVVVASQGYLQGNSTNSDATGNSKNMSKQYEDYAKSVNKTVDQLTELDKKHAIQRESMKIHVEVAGAAARASETLAGAEAKLEVEYTKTKEVVGQALAPAYKLLIQGLSETASFTITVISSFKKFGVSIGHISGMMGAFFRLLKTRDLKEFNKEMDNLAKARDESIKQIEKESKGATFAGSDSKVKTPKKEVKKTAEEIEAEKQRSEENQLKIEKLGHERSLIQLKLDLEDKKITLDKFKNESIAIIKQISNTDIKLKDIELGSVNKNLTAKGLTTDIIQSLSLRKSEIETEIAKINEDTAGKISGIKDTVSSGASKASTAQEVRSARLSATKQALDDEFALFSEQSAREIQVIQDKFNAFEISADEFYSSMKSKTEEDFNRREKLAKAEIEVANGTTASNEAERIDRLAAIASAENNLRIIQEQRKNTLASLTDEQRRYQEELDRFNKETDISIASERASTQIELERVNLDLMLAMNKVSNEERIKLESDFQTRLFNIQLNALRERKKLAKDPKEHTSINAEIESLELQHSVTMQQIAVDMYKEQMKAYTDAMTQVKSFGDEVWGDMRNGFANVKDIIIKYLNDIAMNIAKSALGYEEWFKDGGAISNAIKKLTGTDAVASPSSASGGIPSVIGSVLPGATGAGAGATGVLGSTTGAMNVQAGVVNLNSSAGIGQELLKTDELTNGLSEKFSSVFDSISNNLSSLFSGLGNSLSSILSGIGGGGSSLMSGLGGILSSIPWFDVGADNLSRDQIAMVHKGERILTAKENKTASPLLDNPEKFIRNAVGGGSGQNITNNYNFSNPVDRRTSDQLAAKSAEAMMRAQRNR